MLSTQIKPINVHHYYHGKTLKMNRTVVFEHNTVKVKNSLLKKKNSMPFFNGKAVM